MKINHNRNALIGSVIALLLCVSMLIGTTFAWFTDTVQSDINTIAAGNLDIQLFHDDKETTSDEEVTATTPLFDDVKLWEPGAMVYEKLTVKNNGSLALKYALSININDITALSNGNSLADVLKIAVMDVEPTRENIKTEATQDLASFRLDGTLLANGSTNTYYIAIYWAPSANDNDYNVAGQELSAKLGVVLTATQMTEEQDSFNEKYDQDAAFGVVAAGQAVTLTALSAPATNEEATTSVEVPAGAYNDGDEIEITVGSTNSLFNVNADGAVVGTLDVVLTVNGEKQSQELADGKYYIVTTYVSLGLTDVTISYTGTDGRSQPLWVTYDAATGKLVFATTHFSEYAVSGEAIAYDISKDTAYSTGAAIIEALESAAAQVELPKDLPASDKVEITEAIKAADTLHADAKVTVDEVEYTTADLKAKVENDEILSVTTAGSLDELHAAIANGGSILLTQNVTIEETILIEKDVELDLGGNTLTCNVPGARAIKVAADNVDFVLNANGATINFGNDTYGVLEIGADLNGASITVNNGTFIGTTNGGSFVKLRNGANHTVTLNNVNYTEQQDSKNAYLTDTYNMTTENYNVVINGGYYDLKNGINLDPGAKLTMNNVELTARGVAVEAYNATLTNSKISVTVDRLVSNINSAAIIVSDMGTFTLKGTEINSVSYGLYVPTSGGTIIAENCTIKAVKGNKNDAGENGNIDIVGVPVAWVEELENKTIIAQDGNAITLDCAYTFLPTQSRPECEESGYANWHADFVISVDKDVAEIGEACLAGYYSAWCDLLNDGNWFALDMSGLGSLSSEDELRLVASMGGITVSYGEICEYAIREENTHNGFLCGAFADEKMAGVTIKVELRLYEIDETQSTQSTLECETGNYLTIATFTHTFDNQ